MCLSAPSSVLQIPGWQAESGQGMGPPEPWDALVALLLCGSRGTSSDSSHSGAKGICHLDGELLCLWGLCPPQTDIRGLPLQIPWCRFARWTPFGSNTLEAQRCTCSLCSYGSPSWGNLLTELSGKQIVSKFINDFSIFLLILTIV